MADNSRSAVETRLAAESGISFLSYQLMNCGVSGRLRGDALRDSLWNHMRDKLKDTPNLKGVAPTYDGTTITIPSITLDGGKTFAAQITVPAPDVVRLSVTGVYGAGANGSQQRRISVDLHPTGHPAFGYGIASKGPITLGMNTTITGVDMASDGSIYSEASGLAVSIGSGEVSGDVSTSDPRAVMNLNGTKVGGDIQYNVQPIAMPTVDRSIFTPLATRVVDSSTDFSSGTFKNIRIKANTNPVFGSVTIQGVMYVEAPNNIQFTNNVNFAGVLVADDPPVGSPDSANYIYFKNSMSFQGVDQLPDTPEFAAVRALAGSSVLAPGFTLEFKNNLTAISGVFAVKNLISKNNLVSLIDGSILVYGDAGMVLKNNSIIRVKHTKEAPGFPGYGQAPLKVDPDTYTEN